MIVVVEVSALWLWAVVGVRGSCGAGELYFTSPQCSLLINSVPDPGLVWPFVTHMLLLGNFWALIIRLRTYELLGSQMQNVVTLECRSISLKSRYLPTLAPCTLMTQHDGFYIRASEYIFVKGMKKGSLPLVPHLQTAGMVLLWPEELGASSRPQLALSACSETPEAMAAHLYGIPFAYSNEMGYNWPSLIFFSLS